jgi:hypothetical protein
MNVPTACSARLSTNEPALLAAICAVQDVVASVEQLDVEAEHVLHGGMYARTVRLPAEAVGVGVRIKVPTVLVVHGDVDLLTDAGWIEVRGYGVFAGEPGRKQVFVTRSAAEMTMLMPTAAQTVDEAEREFTDEWEQLLSRGSGGVTCQV